MLINGVDYGRIWLASGVDGFDGESYWFHRPYSLIPGFTKEGFTFVSKTLTSYNTSGNMPLLSDWTPKEYFPRCIWWNFNKGIGLNAVGLSNFGIRQAIEDSFWVGRTEPFMISWMPVTADPINEAKELVARLKQYLQNRITAPVVLQVNFTCPSTGQDLKKLIGKVVTVLRILEELGIPLLLKLNVTTEPEDVADIASKVHLDGLVMSNTIPFGSPEVDIDWDDVVGKISPLTRRGVPQPGGLSGSWLFHLVSDWVWRAKGVVNVPINFCGGVDSPERVDQALRMPGVHSVSVATGFAMRPWRLKRMVQVANSR